MTMPEGDVSVTNRLLSYVSDKRRIDEIGTSAWNLIKELDNRKLKIEKVKIDNLTNFSGFKIPYYQCDYNWKENEIEDFWEDIIRVLNSNVNDRVSEHFFGAMFFADREESESEKLEIIDGQQRLTTIYIILKIIYSELKKLDLEDEDLQGKVNSDINRIKETIYEGLEAGVIRKPTLKLNHRNDPFFQALLEGQERLVQFIGDKDSAHHRQKYNAIKVEDYIDEADIDPDVVRQYDLDTSSSENKEFHEKNYNLLHAYSFLLNKIREKVNSFDSEEEKYFILSNISRYLLESFKIGFFKVTLKDYILIMRIFKLLNDRGMDLSIMDLIKTDICLKLESERVDDERINELVEEWEKAVDRLDSSKMKSLLLDFMTLNTQGAERIREKELLKEVRDNHLQDRRTIEDFVEKIREYASYYSEIINADLRLSDESIKRKCDGILRRLNKLRIKQGRAVILGVYKEVRETGSEQEEILYEVLRKIENLSFRLYITPVSPSKFEKVYPTICETIRENDLSDIDISQELIEEFDNHLGELIFGSSFFEYLLEDWKEKHAKQVFRKLVTEEFEEGEEDMIIRILNSSDTIVQLEHIFPQGPIPDSPSQRWTDKFEWIRNFFITNDPMNEYEEEFEQNIEEFINQGNEETLEEISNNFYDNIGNLTLLARAPNIQIGNKLFSEKILRYYDTKGFDRITLNESFWEDKLPSDKLGCIKEYGKLECKLSNIDEDNWVSKLEDTDLSADDLDEATEKIKSKMEDLEGSEEFEESKEWFDEFWNYQRMFEREKKVLEKLCESLKLKSDEFSSTDIDEEIDNKRKEKVRISNARWEPSTSSN